MNYIVDIILLALIVFFISFGIKKGFVTTLLDSLSLLIASIVSYIFCSPLSQFIYNNFISGIVKSRFTDVLKNTLPSGASLSQKTDALVESLPPFALNIADYAGVDIKGCTSQISSSAAQSAEQLVDAVADKVAYNILIIIVQGLVFLLLFIILAIFVRIISHMIGKILNKLPLIGSVNKLLGGVLGAVKAAIILIAVCTVLYLIVGTSADSDFLSAVGSSKIYQTVTKFNPIIKLFY